MKHRVDNSHRKRRRIVIISASLIAMAVIAVGVGLYGNLSAKSTRLTGPLPVNLPTTPQSYLGVYTNTAPASYSGVTAFANATGARPNILMYYSGWYEPFQTSFATKAAKNSAVPLVQMNPEKIRISAIAAGKYDGYLSAYAEAVRAYRHPVILSFGHEMNGTWYSWGYRHTSPAAFVAAWRHIVTLFRALGAKNVTWLWTVNIINDTEQGRIPPPTPWWPGNEYVTWVGIDGYYLKPGWQFAPLFGPTVTAVRSLTRDPILIGETGATTAANQPAKIADVFSGIHAYGLLGFIWFDARNHQGLDFSINTPASTAAFRNGAGTFSRPGS
jgi:hypothetical protein